MVSRIRTFKTKSSQTSVRVAVTDLPASRSLRRLILGERQTMGKKKIGHHTKKNSDKTASITIIDTTGRWNQIALRLFNPEKAHPAPIIV